MTIEIQKQIEYSIIKKFCISEMATMVDRFIKGL